MNILATRRMERLQFFDFFSPRAERECLCRRRELQCHLSNTSDNNTTTPPDAFELTMHMHVVTGNATDIKWTTSGGAAELIFSAPIGHAGDDLQCLAAVL